MADTVPFGKYKGQPVENMLANRDYMNWLELQPWFRERFSHLMRQPTQIDQSQKTPAHNKLQVLFLDFEYAKAFARVCDTRLAENLKKAAKDSAEDIAACCAKITEVEGKAASFEGVVALADGEICGEDGHCLLSSPFDYITYEYKQAARKHGGPVSGPSGYRAQASEHAVALRREIEKWMACLRALTSGAVPTLSGTKAFEARLERRGIVDVRLTLLGNWTAIHAYHSISERDITNATCTRVFENVYEIEIKPTVADDYPNVLRQMDRSGAKYLFLDQWQGESVTRDQFVQMFRSSGKIVVFKADVDAAVQVGNA